MFMCCCCKGKNPGDVARDFFRIQFVIGYFIRIGWIIILSLMHVRIYRSLVASESNIKIVNNQKASFGQFSTKCGDPLVAMNTTLAADYMN